jgi:hypothetical protein
VAVNNEAPLIESEAEESAPWSAVLEAASRQAAIAESLEALASYFATGPSWEVSTQRALTAQAEDADLARLADAVRLRVLLPLAARLERLVQAILPQPSFRYKRRRDESVGAIRGQLDIPRYVQSRRQPRSEIKYPVLVVERDYVRPENLLTAAAVLLCLRALRAAPTDLLPRGGPEARRVEDLIAKLGGLMRTPLLASIREPAVRLIKRGHLQNLNGLVRQRLNRGHIARPERYEDVLNWFDDFERGVHLAAAEVEWAFYDARFDPKLFELWILTRVRRALSDELDTPVPELVPLWQRADGPVVSWRLPGLEIHLHFQREFANVLASTARWVVRGNPNRPLRGIPDLTFEVVRSGVDRQFIFVDAKLRRGPASSGQPEQHRLPTEELYKLLGYFENSRLSQVDLGVLVFYAPAAEFRVLLEAADLGSGPTSAGSTDSEAVGKVLVLGMDPGDPESVAPLFGDLAHLIKDAAAGDAFAAASDVAEEALQAGVSERESKIAYRQRLAVEMIEAASSGHQDEIARLEKSLEGRLGSSTWDACDAETRLMLTSAEFYGSLNVEDLDHSGPLLGVCAACERELNERLLDRVRQTFPDLQNEAGEDLIRSGMPLGYALFLAGEATRLMLAEAIEDSAGVDEVLARIDDDDSREAVGVVAAYLRDARIPPVELRQLVRDFKRLNFRYRIPAAHDQSVRAEKWWEGREAVLARESGLLRRLVDLLP